VAASLPVLNPAVVLGLRASTWLCCPRVTACCVYVVVERSDLNRIKAAYYYYFYTPKYSRDKTDEWSGYMPESSEAAKKLSP